MCNVADRIRQGERDTYRPLLRYPTVSDCEIAFVYAGDVWIGGREGGDARLLTSASGQELFPRFSPSGDQIAFMGNYGAGGDVHVVHRDGGVPKRLTFHPTQGERVVGWMPPGDDGASSVLFSSDMESGQSIYPRLFEVPTDGALPHRISVAVATYGAVSSQDWLAFQIVSPVFSSWKGYRGGQSPEIYLLRHGAEAHTAVNLTNSADNDSHPMWSADGSRLYFLSDRAEGGADGGSERYNIWAIEGFQGLDIGAPDLGSLSVRKLTTFVNVDVRNPSIGPRDLVFEVDGQIHRLDLATEQVEPLTFRIGSSRRFLGSRLRDVSNWIRNFDLSPRGRRAVFEARGNLFSVPTGRDGVVRSLVGCSRFAARYPTWSPCGQWLAYFTDRSDLSAQIPGNYQLAIRPSDGSGAESVLTQLGKGYRYRPFWSPDGGKIAFIDQDAEFRRRQEQRRRIRYYDFETSSLVVVDDNVNWIVHSGLERFKMRWSPCGRWLAYARKVETGYDAIFLFDTEHKQLHQVTSGFYSDREPTFDPDGQYLFFFTNRSFPPTATRFQGGYQFGANHIGAVPLRRDVPKVFEPTNEEEASAEEPGQQGEPKPSEESVSLDIDLPGFEERVELIECPNEGRLSALHAQPGRLLFIRRGVSGQGSVLEEVRLGTRKLRTLISGVSDFAVSLDRKSLLAVSNRRYAYFSLAGLEQRAVFEIEDGRVLPTERLSAIVVPRDEWQQIFDDAWRVLRDFIFDPRLAGPDWNERYQHYSCLLRGAVSRWDLNFILQEMAGELDVSHAVVSGGDVKRGGRTPVGLLGADFKREKSGAIRVTRILNGAPWDSEVRSPLFRAGIQPCDRLEAINGVAVGSNPWRLLEGHENQTIELSFAKGGKVLVRTLTFALERRLRYLDWVEQRRRFVANSNSQIGYIQIPSISAQALREFTRQLRAQMQLPGLIFDVRFNYGGSDPYRFLELIGRQTLFSAGDRFGEEWLSPEIAHQGPKAMLINGWTGSFAEVLAAIFEKQNHGPLIGAPTLGGTVGSNGAPLLVDGGRLSAPNLPPRDIFGNLIGEGDPIQPSSSGVHRGGIADNLIPDHPMGLPGGVEDLSQDVQLLRAIESVAGRITKIEHEPKRN